MSALDAVTAAGSSDRELISRLIELISQQRGDVHANVQIVSALNDLTEAVTLFEQRLMALEDSSPSEQPSLREMLEEITKTHTVFLKRLDRLETVKAKNGTTYMKGDVQALAIMQTLTPRIEKMIESSNDVVRVVNDRGRITIDIDRLTKNVLSMVDQRLEAAITKATAGYETRVATLAFQHLDDAAAKIDEVRRAGDEMVVAANAVERRFDRLASKVGWATAGRFSIALLPWAAVLLVIGGLTMGIFHALGFGPILGWAWDAFAASNTWSSKVLIMLGTFGGLGCFGGLVWWAAAKLRATYRGW